MNTPSLSQAQELHRLSKSYQLEVEIIEDVLSEEKPNQIPKISISYESLKNYLPRSMVTPREIEEYLYTLQIENGYMQELEEHEEEYVPNFDLSGI